MATRAASRLEEQMAAKFAGENGQAERTARRLSQVADRARGQAGS